MKTLKELRTSLGFWAVSDDKRVSDLVDLLVAEGVSRESAEAAVGAAFNRGTVDVLDKGLSLMKRAINGLKT